MNVTLEQFLGTLLYAPVEAHILHLKTHGYSKHMALDDFYKEAPDKADEIAEQTFGHIDPIQEYVNVLSYRDYADPVSYLESLRQFIVESRKIIYNPEKHSNIYSAIDDYLSLIDSTTYKLAQLYEGLDSIDFNQSEAQKQYIAGTLTYGGKNVRRFFDDNAAKISAIVEAKIGRQYRIVSRNYAAIFYSKLTKRFVVVFESYNKGYYCCAAMPMIDFYSPDILTQTSFFKASTPQELVEKIQTFSKTYIPIYISQEL